MRHVLTSEAVTRGHPDKLCDQVADGVLDALLTEDPEARAACEAAVWENHLLLFGEISARQEPDYEAVAREVLRDIGYDRPGLGLDAEFLENAVVYTAIPDAILGLSSENYRTLNVSPSLPAGFECFKLENLTFCYRKYDCCVGSDFVRISNVSKLQNRDDDVWITVRFLKPEKAFRVYVDGQITEYVDEGTTVSVTVPFKSTFVKIG